MRYLNKLWRRKNRKPGTEKLGEKPLKNDTVVEADVAESFYMENSKEKPKLRESLA